jgi:hypothetical protein
LSGGKLKVFRSLNNWLSEFRLYRRDEKGAVVKAQDHLMDSTRYLIMSGLDIATTGEEKVRAPVMPRYGSLNATVGY